MQPAKSTHRPQLFCKSGNCFSCFSLYPWTASSPFHTLISTCLLHINVTEKGYFTRRQKGWSPALGTGYLATHLIKYCPLQYFLQKHPMDKSICFIPKGFPAYCTAPSLHLLFYSLWSLFSVSRAFLCPKGPLLAWPGAPTPTQQRRDFTPIHNLGQSTEN